jgi:Transposase
MPYKIAGIDVHKRMLHVVVSDVEVDGEYKFTRRVFGSYPEALRSLAAWLVQQQVEEVVMESTAQYWKPVWGALERYWKPICGKRESARRRSGTLHLAQALSNRGRRGRKKDFRDAERLVKRLVANELTLSFVPDVEQRLWRTIMRTKYQLTCNRVQLQNRLEALLEAHIKLSSLVSDLLGASARRMLKALAEGETDPMAGFLFVPLTMAAYVGLSESKSNAAAGLINFTRNIGQSVGTSRVTTLLARRGQYHQSVLAEYTRSHRFDTAVAGLTSRLTHVGLSMHSAQQQALARMYSVVMAQAQALSYVDIYWLLAATSALMFLLCFLLAKNEPSKGGRVAVH